MRKIVLGLGLITVIGVICVIGGYLFANPGSGSWEEGSTSAFTGTHSNTQGINSNMDVTLFGCTPVTIDASAGVRIGKENSIARDSNNKLHIAYLNWTANDLKYATNKSGSWQKETIDSTGNVGYYISIAVDNADGVHISYMDGTNIALKYAYHANPNPPAGGCHGGWWWFFFFTNILFLNLGWVYLQIFVGFLRRLPQCDNWFSE